MTPFHPLRTLFGISNPHIVCSISYPHPLWPPKTPYQPQSLECFSFPSHRTPFHHLWTLSLILSHDWSISLAYLSPYDPLRPPKTPYQPMYLLLVNVCSCVLWQSTPNDPLSPHMYHISYIESYWWISLTYVTPYDTLDPISTCSWFIIVHVLSIFP